MFVHFGTELLRPEWPRAIVCVGTFDGVHLGHQEVIRTAVVKANEAEKPCIVATFDRHPAATLYPSKCPRPVASLRDNLCAIEALGVALTVVLPFNAWLSRMAAERFLREMLIGTLRAEELVVGHDFAMGNEREGDTEWLAARIETTVVPPFRLEGERVSSSAIRSAIECGDVELAHKLLGRPFCLDGIVVTGQKLGRTLGFPTINLARTFEQVLPCDGIYAARAEFDGVSYMAAVSIGVRPAVGGTDRTIEAFLLDFPGHSLYGQAATLRILHRIRDEHNYPSLEALTAQIQLDVDEVRRLVTRT